MDDKRVNEGKILLFPSIFSEKPRETRARREIPPGKCIHPALDLFSTTLYTFLPRPFSSLSFYLSFLLSFSLRLPLSRLVYTPSVGPSIPLRQKEFMNEERSPRDASGTGGDSLLPSLLSLSLPPSLCLPSNNRRIRSTGLVLGMSCE